MTDDPASPIEPTDAASEQIDAASGTSRPGPGGDGAPLDPTNEETIWTGRTHWQYHFGVIMAGFGLVLVMWLVIALVASWAHVDKLGAFLACLGLTVAAFVAIGGWLLLKIFSRRYRLTGQRLFIEKGILSQTIDQTELIRVDDVRIRKRLVDRIFGLGSIDILSTDATDQAIVIEGVKNAEGVAEHVRLRMRTLRSRSLFVERL